MSANDGATPVPETAALRGVAQGPGSAQAPRPARTKDPGPAGASRFAQIFRLDLSQNVARPLFWILILILALTAWGLSKGEMQISSGNAAVGGTKAWITSEFSNAKMLSMVIFLFYSFFIAVAAGMAFMRDEELKVGELLHATGLRPAEYFWGKLAAVVTSFLAILVLHLALSIFFNHVLPNPKAVEIRGPFALAAYLRPALILGLPSILFIAGATFAIGERTRRPILVFVLPLAAVLVCAFFLWDWSPSWLDPRINRFLMLVDPAGVRWLSETWLKVDRGVDFYNHQPIRYDLPFALSRIGFVLIGLVALLAAQRHLASSLRGSAGKRATRKPREKEIAGAAEAPAPAAALAGVRSRPPRFWPGLVAVLSFELRELRAQPGLYLFIPIILLQTLGTTLVAVGAFSTPLLVTPGTVAVRSMNTLTFLFCLLSLFYTVESLRRERHTGIASIYYSTAARTSSILFGKVLANAVVGLLVVAATLLGCVIALLVQHKVAFDPRPFAVVWGFGLVPTFLLWTSFVMTLFAITNNRYTTYALGLAVLALTGYLQATNRMSWAGNWNLWGSLLWSDMGTLELSRVPLFWNRLFALGLAVFFTALTARIFPRRDRDAVRTVHRLAPGSLWRSARALAPYAVVPLAAVIVLWVQVNRGFQGKAEEKVHKDYWKQNLATWKDVPLPGIARADLDLELMPRSRSFRMAGSYLLSNRTQGVLRQIPLTGGSHWQDVAWTLNGTEYKPEDRTRLYVFTPPRPLSPGDTVRIGFRYHGVFPKGITKNGGGTGEFILPSGVVLTSFSSSFVPVLGYQEDVGVDKDNRYEPKVYPDDYYKGLTEPAFGSALPFTTRIRITGPAEYTLNSVGTRTSDTVQAGKRISVWESDHPVRFFNVVAGRWKAREGEGTVVYYHPAHTYNIEEMVQALDASRRYYSEWFMPFPWKQLKLSEFPANAFYAQGFPTDITFSEGIGFLTRSDPKSDAAFWVTAHESAHQWWGNILTPGKGPGGDILAEGTAHFSTILLLEQVKGERARIEFCKRIESQYGDDRQVDSERPLIKIDGTKPGDTAVTYAKGGWVFWMLLNEMGREPALAGMRSFIAQYKDGPDYPLVEDFVESMRPFAPDSADYRAFTREWFFQVVVPEYRLEAHREKATPGGETATAVGMPPDSARWVARVHLENIGSGSMPVEVAACSGERFDKEGKPSPGYREERATVTLAAKEGTDITVPCPFKPDRVVVDPDAKVLQLRREAAIVRF